MTILASCYCLQQHRSKWLCQLEQCQYRERMHTLPERRLPQWPGRPRRIRWPGSRRTRTNKPIRPWSCSLMPPLMLRAEGGSLFARDVRSAPGQMRVLNKTKRVLFFSGSWPMSAAPPLPFSPNYWLMSFHSLCNRLSRPRNSRVRPLFRLRSKTMSCRARSEVAPLQRPAPKCKLLPQVT